MTNYPYADRYSDKKYTNPSDSVDPKKKQSAKYNPQTSEQDIGIDYFLRKMQFIYSDYLRNGAFIPYGSLSDIVINRLYAQGRQPIAKYRELLTLKQKSTGMRKGWHNMSWDIVPILPKFRARVLGEFDGFDFGTNVYAIDEYSGSRREDMKLELVVKNKYKEELEPLQQAIGVKEEQQQLPFQPNNMQEANTLAEMGFLKLEEEIVYDGLCIATEQRCGWTEVKKRIMEDLIDIGWGGCKDYTDVVNNKPMVRYIDPQYTIVRQTRMNNFMNVTEAAEIVWYSIADLKMNGFDDNMIRRCVNAFQGMYGNPNWSYSAYTPRQNRWDDFKIAVLDGEFSSFDTCNYETVLKDGKEITFDLPYNIEEIQDSNKKIYKQRPDSKRFKKQYQKLYRAKWVIGTDIIFDNGLQYDVQYTPNGVPKSSFTLYRVSDRSMMSQCISIADDIQLTILKKRNAITNAAPPGIMVEWGSLSGMELGGEKVKPFDILKIYRDTGDLLFRYALSDNGTPIQGGIAPITELPGGLGTYVQELNMELQTNLNLLREITGINASSDASSPAPDAAVGTSMLANQATLKVLKPIISAYQNIKQRAFGNVVTRWQLSNKFYNITSEMIGDKRIDIPAGSYDMLFDAYCNEIITDQEKMNVEQACLASMQAAKTGAVGIQMSDYLMIKQFLARNNVRAAWLYLVFSEQKMQAMMQLTADRNQQLNNQAAAQQSAIASETELMKIKAKGEEDRKTNMQDWMYRLQETRMKEASKPAPPVVEQPKEKAA